LPNVQVKRWIPRIIVLALVAGAVAFVVVKKPWAKARTRSRSPR